MMRMATKKTKNKKLFPEPEKAHVVHKEKKEILPPKDPCLWHDTSSGFYCGRHNHYKEKEPAQNEPDVQKGKADSTLSGDL